MISLDNLIATELATIQQVLSTIDNDDYHLSVYHHYCRLLEAVEEANAIARQQWEQELDEWEQGRPELPAGTDEVDAQYFYTNWERRNPAAFARWNRVRPATQEMAEQLNLPPENLVSPDTLRRIAYEPPTPLDAESVDARLAELGQRPWQRERLVPLLVELLAD